MQQYLPFTVLKLINIKSLSIITVATVLTVYGIETPNLNATLVTDQTSLQQYLPFTVLKLKYALPVGVASVVATVLTVYGIETHSLV